jgi:hypothetical protein
MSGNRNWFRPLFMALCVGVTAAGLLNVYGDNADVIGRAQTVACGSPGCAVTMTSMTRSPLAQEFTFQTRLTAKGASPVEVAIACRREFVLVGDYRCQRKGAAE